MVYMYMRKASHLPDTLISVGIYTETWNLNVVIAVTYLPPPTAEDCWKNSNSFHNHHLKWNARYNVTYSGMLRGLTASVISNIHCQQLHVHL